MKKLGFAAVTVLLLAGCFLAPGPISVDVRLDDQTRSGYGVFFIVSVENQGAGDVTINRATLHEKVTAGWGVGMPGTDGTIDLPLSTTTVNGFGTSIIFERLITYYNVPPSGTPTYLQNLEFTETVTVSSDGGSDSDTEAIVVAP